MECKLMLLVPSCLLTGWYGTVAVPVTPGAAMDGDPNNPPAGAAEPKGDAAGGEPKRPPVGAGAAAPNALGAGAPNAKMPKQKAKKKNGKFLIQTYIINTIIRSIQNKSL